MELSYETIMQELVNTCEAESDTLWRRAALIYVATERMKIKAGDIAGKIFKSGSHVRQLKQTFAAFPEETDRLAELTFSHHAEAARTDNPKYWLAQAADHSWSVRELRRAAKGETVKDVLREAETAWNKVLKIIEGGGPAGAWLEQQVSMYEV